MSYLQQTVSIAATSRLNQIIQPRQGADHTAKGKINPGFYQLRADADNLLSLFQSFPYLFQHITPVFRAHGITQMEQFSLYFSFQGLIYSGRSHFGIKNGKHLFLLFRPLPDKISRLFNANAFSSSIRTVVIFHPPEFRFINRQLSRHINRHLHPVFCHFFKWRLRCRTQHHCRACKLCQEINGQIKQPHDFNRKRLHLIKDNYTVTQAVKPAEISFLFLIQGLKKLNRRSHDKRNLIPVFYEAFIPPAFLFLLKNHVSMVLQHPILIPNRLSDLFCVLIQDTFKWRHVKNMSFFRFTCPTECKPQGTQSLSRSGRDRQPVPAGTGICRPLASYGNFLPNRGERRIRFLSRFHFLQTAFQILQTAFPHLLQSFLRYAGGRLSIFQKINRIPHIRIRESRKQQPFTHPHIK